MASSPYKETASIFISYRRGDSSGDAARLYEKLEAHFGEGQIFMDVGSVDWGAEFGSVIQAALTSSEILIAIIGPHWLQETKEKRRSWRRRKTPDWVEIEIATALDKGIYVIPLLMHGVRMPLARQLPNSLKRLANLNGISLSIAAWQEGVEELVHQLDSVLAGQRNARRYWERDSEARKVREAKAREEQQAKSWQDLQVERQRSALQFQRVKQKIWSIISLAVTGLVLYFIWTQVLPLSIKTKLQSLLPGILAKPTPTSFRIPGNFNRTLPVTLPSPKPSPTGSLFDSRADFVNEAGMQFEWIPFGFNPANARHFSGGYYLSKRAVTYTEWNMVVILTNGHQSLKVSQNLSGFFDARFSNLEKNSLIKQMKLMKDDHDYRLAEPSEIESNGRSPSGFWIVALPKPNTAFLK
jgi:hypothetical protein